MRKVLLGDICVDWRIILKCHLNRVRGCRLHLSGVFLLTNERWAPLLWLTSSRELSSKWHDIQDCFKQNVEFCIEVQVEVWGIPLTVIHLLPVSFSWNALCIVFQKGILLWRSRSHGSAAVSSPGPGATSFLEIFPTSYSHIRFAARRL
jgi:hypothetical protein